MRAGMKIKPFKALRPVAGKAGQVASRPYDVLDSNEARIEAGDNPCSFLRIVKPEITLAEGTDPYSPQVYAAGRANFQQLLDKGIFFQEQQECLYIYELIREGRSQSGIVACAWVEDYTGDRIKKHELTRPDKELDRVNHIRVSMLNAEPVFLAYRPDAALEAVVEAIKKDDPVYDFKADDGVAHRLWVVKDGEIINTIVAGFDNVPATYVADGHHRTAAAVRVGIDLKNANPNHTGAEQYNYFLAVHFPADELQIFDYNRVVKDLNGLSPEQFIKQISRSFTVAKQGRDCYQPRTLHEIGMYLDGNWYVLKAHDDTYDDADPIGVLDNTILSQQILGPVLNITDLRADKRIDFVGGIRGLRELQHRVDSGAMKVAFAMYAVSMQQLLDIADTGNIMPPKSTWFEPKLRSGLLVHSLEK
jgi:uncharacterized protein (DUF1015 family)